MFSGVNMYSGELPGMSSPISHQGSHDLQPIEHVGSSETIPYQSSEHSSVRTQSSEYKPLHFNQLDHNPSNFFNPYGGFAPQYPPALSMPSMQPVVPIPSFFGANPLNSNELPQISSSQSAGGPIRIKNGVDRERFEEVPGRLCLLSGSTKYPVTIAELKRRMAPPETLHVSLLNAILRKGKAKDNGKSLQTALKSHGINLASGRRKTSATTGFTALCEAEAIRLARQWNELLTKEAGIPVLSQAIVQKAQELGRDDKTYIRDLQGFISVMDAISTLYNNIPEDPDDIVPQNEAEHAINRLSLLTHGFGHNAIKAYNQFMKNVADSALSHYQQEQPQPIVPPTAGYMSHLMQPPFYNL